MTTDSHGRPAARPSPFWLAVAARWLLGGVFIYMGLSKALNPVEFLKLVREYGLLATEPLGDRQRLGGRSRAADEHARGAFMRAKRRGAVGAQHQTAVQAGQRHRADLRDTVDR